jgi:single-stranded-DNA-specific exonuclease
MTPVFISENVISRREPMVVGSNHLRLSLAQVDNPDITFNAIGFDMGEFQKIAASDKPFKICYSLRENEWNDVKSIELNLKDLKA